MPGVFLCLSGRFQVNTGLIITNLTAFKQANFSYITLSPCTMFHLLYKISILIKPMPVLSLPIENNTNPHLACI